MECPVAAMERRFEVEGTPSCPTLLHRFGAARSLSRGIFLGGLELAAAQAPAAPRWPPPHDTQTSRGVWGRVGVRFENFGGRVRGGRLSKNKKIHDGTTSTMTGHRDKFLHGVAVSCPGTKKSVDIRDELRDRGE